MASLNRMPSRAQALGISAKNIDKTSFMVILATMNSKLNQNEFHAKALAALGHTARLDVFRLLVRAGGEGLIVGDIVAHTGLPQSTLAHHLRALVSAGLVVQERRGREIYNRADMGVMDEMIGFLTDECCAGVSLDGRGAA